MPRPPSPESRRVRILTHFDVRPYELPDDKTEFDLLLRTHLTGPLSKPPPKPPPGRRIKSTEIETCEMLELRSKTPMAEEEMRRHVADLESEKTVQLQMEFGHFDSTWTDDHDLYELDLSGLVTIYYDRLGRLRADATFDQEWLLGFGKKLVSKRLDDQVLGHCELRLWHILSCLSPQLEKQLRAATGLAMASFRHPLAETLQAVAHPYYVVGPPADSKKNDNSYRNALLNALVDDKTVLNVAQICVVFGKENANVFNPTETENIFYPARDVTITRMISEAGLKSVSPNHYDARQITHILVPFAVAYRDEQRYLDLKEALIDSGISVPESPMT